MNAAVGFIRAIRLIFLLLIRPGRFAEEEAEDNARLNASSSYDPEHEEPRLVVVRRAFFYSLFLVLTAVTIGCILGLILGCVFGCTTAIYTGLLQGVGAGVVLWGVLFVRGWDIQSYVGHTLSEQVNRWIYRTLQFVGTAFVFCALTWPQCSP